MKVADINPSHGQGEALESSNGKNGATVQVQQADQTKTTPDVAKQHDTPERDSVRPELSVLTEIIEDGQAPKAKSQNAKSARALLDVLLKTIQVYSPDADLEAIREAYTFAEEAHRGQRRQSGEPYITHPLQVAIILAEMRLDFETIQAALLHDTIEDTEVTYDDMSKSSARWWPTSSKA